MVSAVETRAPSAPGQLWLHALRADTCVEEAFGMLSLPASFARAIELSRQSPLCKFHNHMVRGEVLDDK